jgi:hypothetical protein
MSLSSVRVVLQPPEQRLGVLLAGLRDELREATVTAPRGRGR